jgi:hypothetical protein
MAAERSTEDDECHNCGRFDDVLDLFSIEEGGAAEDGGAKDEDRRQQRRALLGFRFGGAISIWEWLATSIGRMNYNATSPRAGRSSSVVETRLSWAGTKQIMCTLL